MKIYKHTIFALAALTVLSLSAQESGELKKASKYFDGYSYSKAIEKYEPIEEKTTDIKRKLAESYANTGNSEKSEMYYGEVVKASDKTPSDVYAYASILSKNGKHAEAEKKMQEYARMSGSDSRGAQYTANPGFYTALLKDEGQFSIKNIAANSSQEDFGPAFYKEKVVFASSREGVVPVKRTWNWNGLPFLDMYEATPSDENELSGISELLKGKKNKKYHEGPVSFNAAGDYMVFTRNNYKEKSSDGVVKLELYSSKLIEGEWQEEEALPYNNKEYSVGHASLSPDAKTLYFASDMPGGKGGVDIYKASRKEDGTWGKAENLGDNINTEGNEMFPFIHSKGDQLFFASDGHQGLGGLDVFITEVKGSSYGKVKNVGVPVNGTKDDFSFILDKEEKKGYFASNRTEGKGDDDIYSFKLLKPFSFGKLIKGIVKDKKGNILTATEVVLYDGDGNEVGKAFSAEDGSYSFTVDPDQDFKLSATREDYFEGKNNASTKTEEEVIVADLILEKDPGLSLYALVTDKKTAAALEGVKMTITDNIAGDVVEYITPATGDYRRPLADKKLQDRGSYNLTLEREGYFTKTVTYNTEFKKAGQYDVHATLDLSMDKEVNDLSQLIEINPINFDLNKYAIRADASKELDKIVSVMNKYQNMVVELGSHTDARGSDAYNRKLSDRKSKSISGIY